MGDELYPFERRVIKIGELKAGDTVILLDKRQRRHMITLKDGGRFSSQYGFIEHADILGKLSGSVAKTSKGVDYIVFAASYRDYVLHIKRQAQIIYPKDTAIMLMWGDIKPSLNVLEAGIGQGALSLAILRALGETGRLTSYEVRADFAAMSRKFIAQFLGSTPFNHNIEIRDIYEGIDGVYDRVLLDLPEPWRVLPHLATGLIEGGSVVSYLPTVLQVKTYVDELKAVKNYAEIETFELILRPWKVDGLSVRPETWIYNHSAFIISARKTARNE